jgi:uncharacterized protein (DUF1330 family)
MDARLACAHALDCVLRSERRVITCLKGYWVALADVSDPEGYELYVAENAKAFRKYHGHFLTRGGQSERPEGTTRSRVVVIEFPDYKAALECYRSSDYANAMALREGKSEMDLVIIEGYDGPQPTVLSVPSTVEGRALVSKFHSACHRNCLPRPGRSLVGRLPWFFDCSRIHSNCRNSIEALMFRR